MATEKKKLNELLRLASQLPKEQQLELIAKLSLSLRAENVKKKERPLPDPQKDPIMKIIGISEVEPFARDLDRQLYGE
ncbi:MAG: hypothetical protein AB1374_00695 [Bacillota bacterium]